jgi:hypothetical protein
MFLSEIIWEFLVEVAASLATFPVTTGIYDFSTLPDNDNHLIESCLGRDSYATEDISQCASVIAPMMATEAQYVCGAGTCCLLLRWK